MKPERWERIAALYHAALARPAFERAAFLDQACADADLRREIESLLAEPTQGGLLTAGAAVAAAEFLGSSEPLPVIGLRFGIYQVQSLLGRGGMGEVYRARDCRLQRDVALKFLPAATLNDPTARARLLREARAAASLNHPSICTVHEVGEADGRAYIAMELVEGKPLSDWTAGRALPVADILSYATQIADALAHAHERQIVHRDLKSANVMITAGGRVKVLDFGLSKRLSGQALAEVTTADHGPATLTEPGMLVGTLAYMAPEQLRGEPADVRSDLWALGVVLYEIAVGRRPFHGRSSFDLCSAILQGQPTPLPSSVPPALRAIIERCLEKQPERRYQRAMDVRTALEASRAARFQSIRYRLTRHPAVTWGVAVAVGVAVVAGLNVERLRTRLLGGARLESLAVLPLDNLSGDPAQDYFADGMTEVLSTDLARLGALKRVTARGSVLQYKGKNRPLAEIARELNVDALVMGSVVRSGNRVSVTAQLLDPATGDQLWSNRYERDLQDVLVLRNEIVAAIVREIRAELSPAEAARLASIRQVNPEAFEAYLKGRFHWLKQTREDYDVAERYFQMALDKDPGYALGYAGLSSVWMMRGDAGFRPTSETFPKASALMGKAFELDTGLDTELAELHVLLANHTILVTWDWNGAEREFQQAIEVNPNLADAHFYYADLLVAQKRIPEWNREIQRALELDPLNEFQRTYYGWQLNYQRRFDEAIPIFQKLLPTGPNKAANYLGLWGAYYHKRMFPQAAAAAREYFVSASDGEFADTLGSGVDEARYREGMKRTADAMVAGAKQRHVPAIRVARMFAHAGNRDLALDWLERAYQNHESPMTRLAVVWDWHELHSAPRFQALLRRLNLPQ